MTESLAWRHRTYKFGGVKSITMEALRHDLTVVRKSVEKDSDRWIVTFRDSPRFAIVPLADLERLRRADARAKPARRRK